MAGVYYIWIMAAFFLSCGGIIVLFTSLLYLGHWLQKKETGAKHGFLELPEELRRPSPVQPEPPPVENREP